MPGLDGGPPQRRAGRRRAATLAPLGLYGALALLFFGRTTGWSDYVFGQGADPLAFVWFLNWWPYAIWHGLNPFVTHTVWFPDGANLMWVTSVPLAALLSLPVTLLGGPVLAFNLLTVMAPALSAWTAFLLARAVAGDWLGAVAAGYIFGFSSYELGHLVGHLNLDLTFLVPLAVLLCVRRARDEMGRARFVLCLALVLVAQLCQSTEILATLCVCGMVVWAMFLAFAPRQDGWRLWRLAGDIALTSAATVILAAPFLVYLISGYAGVPHELNAAVVFSADPLNYLIPNNLTALGNRWAGPIARHFTGIPPEQGAYLGLPLVALLVIQFRSQIGRRAIQAFLAAMLALIVLSLGPRLHLGGGPAEVPLPWALVQHLPLMTWVLPGRITLYVALCAAMGAALAVASGAPKQRPLRLALAVLACVALAPNTAVFAWTPWPAQPFFTPANVERALGKAANVVILPFGYRGDGMAWQVAADMRFTQSGGSIGITPPGEARFPALRALAEGKPGPGFANDLAAYCGEHRVNAILIGPGTAPALASAIRATGWPGAVDRGIEIIRVPPAGALSYTMIEGDYWPSGATENWMGRTMRVTHHGPKLALTVFGKGRPAALETQLTVTDAAGQTRYPIGPDTVLQIDVPRKGAVTLTADGLFIPAETIHNGDQRALSVLVSVGPPAP